MPKQTADRPQTLSQANAAQLSGRNSREAAAVSAFGNAIPSLRPAPARQLPAVPVMQQQAVVQRREISQIDADLDIRLAAINAIAPLGLGSSVGAITARQAALAALPAQIDPLAVEVAAKGGGAAPTLAAVDKRIGEIDSAVGRLSTDIAEGEGPQPTVTNWAEMAKKTAWADKNKNVAANKAKRTELSTEKDTLIARRPVSVLKDKLARFQNAYAALKANLVAAEKERYFILLMTTVTPVKTKHQYEGMWQSGPSDLGIFMFSAGPIQGIPDHGIRVEVHIHFAHNTNTVNRAHIKSGWAYTVLYPNPPGYAAAYAATAVAACRALV